MAAPAAGLAEAGFHAVAPDQRGYGQTDRPEPIEAYTLLHLIGDIVGLLDALGDQRPSSSATTGARRSPGTARCCGRTVFRAVVGLSVPFRPRGASRPPT